MKAGAVLAVAASGLIAGGAAGHRGLSVSVAGGVVSPGDRVVVHVAGAVPAHRLRLVLLLYPLYMTEAPIAIGSVTPDRRGRAQLSFALPQVGADMYVPAACCVRGVRVIGHGLLSVPAVAPAGFGPLGAPGCAPSSPRNTDTTTPFARSELFGTAVGAQLWVLAGSAGTSLSDASLAVLQGVIGKEEKIIFRMTSGVPKTFFAVAPNGSRVPPIWGPDPHLGSNWNRPGAEWGAGFVFTQPGCWQIHAASPPAVGDVWLSVSS
jgi:hypothetical protein